MKWYEALRIDGASPFGVPVSGAIHVNTLRPAVMLGRGVIMREAKNGEDVSTAEGGWLDWLGDCGVAAISGVDTRALVRQIRDRGAMRGGIFSAETSDAEAQQAIVFVKREEVGKQPFAVDGGEFADQSWRTTGWLRRTIVRDDRLSGAGCNQVHGRVLLLIERRGAPQKQF